MNDAWQGDVHFTHHAPVGNLAALFSGGFDATSAATPPPALAEFAAGLTIADFADELDALAADFDVEAGHPWLLDGERHRPPVSDRKARGKVAYRGNWRETPDGVRFPMLTISTFRHGGRSGSYHGLRRVHQLYRAHLDGTRPARPTRPSLPTEERPTAPDVAKDRKRASAAASRIVRLHAYGEPGERLRPYLAARGLHPAVVPDAIRFVPAVAYWHELDTGELVQLGSWPAMAAAVRDLLGCYRGIHLTYLAPDLTGKALIQDPEHLGELLPARKLRTLAEGSSRGAAIQLHPFQPGAPLLLAEGIETALAATQLTGWPCWSCISAGGLQNAVLPDGADDVVVMADHDLSGTGERAAQDLAARLAREGRKVRIVLPPGEIAPGAKSRDWADVAAEVALGRA